MKKVYLLALYWVSAGMACAQSERSAPLVDSLRLRMEQIFAPLDKAQVPTGYLAEFASPLLEPYLYTGTLSDSNRTDLTVFHYLRATMASARITGTDTLPDARQLNERLDAAQAHFSGAIPIAVQYMNYARIRPEAIEQNLLRVQNQQVFDVAGRTQSPYTTQFLFAAAPATAFSATGAVSFVFKQNLNLTNSSSPQSIQLDFGDGRGYQSANWGQPIGTTYTTPGIKRIKVKYKFRFFTQIPRESHFDFEVLNIPAAARYNAAVGFTKTFAPDYVTYRHSGGSVRVVYGAGNGNEQLRKPFIVAEGYNLADTAPNLIKCNNPNNDVKKFLDDIYINFTQSGNFGEALHAAGYDVVYIDNNKGADDIRRNAALFEEVVSWVNQKKRDVGSQEQNVVIGQSMGGLVARYGLAEMVRNPEYFAGIDLNAPQTRLLILHDSPQRGANNPVGVQSLTRSLDVPFFLGRYSFADMAKESIGEVVKVLNQPATAQLSICNAYNGRGDIRANTFIDGEYQQMINFSLYPSPYQPAYAILAVSDGSQCARPQNIQPRTVLTQTTAEFFLRPVPVLSNFNFKADLAAYALPASGQRAEISHARVWCEFNLCIGKGPFKICIPILPIYGLRESAMSPAGALPLETLPGGTTNPNEGVDCTQNLNMGVPALFKAYLRTTLYNGDICFVPTYSALDVPAATSSSAYARYLGGISSGSDLPRVARFIANEAPSAGTQFNLPHLRFTARNAEWLFREMQNDQPGTVLCSALAECAAPGALPVTGPATLCGSGTYSLPIQGNGLTYSWTASPAYLFTTATGTGPTFTTSNAGSGQGTITVTVTGACSFTFTRSVNVGAPAPADIQATEIPDGCNTFGGSFQITNLDPTLSYSVSVSGSLRLFGGFSASTGIIRVKTGTQRGPGYVTVTTTNACGSTSSAQTAEVAGCDFYTVYPNPAQDEATVVATEPAAAAARATTAPEFEVALYNGQGRRVYQGRSQHGQAKLPLRELPAGLYQLHAGQGNRQERHTVQVRP